MHVRLGLWFVAAVAASLCLLTAAVNPGEFKACSDSSFCRRFRRRAEYTESFGRFVSPYSAGPPKLDAHVLRLPVHSALYENIAFDMTMTLFADGNARVQMDEAGPTYEGRQHYNEAGVWGIASMPQPATNARLTMKEGHAEVHWGEHDHSVLIELQPLRLSFVRDGVVQAVLNERSLLHMEHYRAKPESLPEDTEEARQLVFQERKTALKKRHKAPSATLSQWSQFEVPDAGEWEETWAGTTDSKPRGPEGIGLDISFPGYGTLYGLPEHASPLSLRSTRAPPKGEKEEPNRFSEPYRMMNTDVFEYEYDNPRALYGNAPVLHAVSQRSAVSVLWMNAADTYVDLHKTAQRSRSVGVSRENAACRAGGSSSQTSHAYFYSEAGILDLFVFLQPSLAQNMEAYMRLVGRTALPQYFALGYHQSRWNYLSDEDVLEVSRRFDEADMPVDVIWLDIEYSKDHMYGVWDRGSFVDPEGMLAALDARGRKLVIIMDPHLKATNAYYLYNQAKDLDLLVKRPDGREDFVGKCWSGEASWIDFFKPKTWAWWIDQHSLASGQLFANARNLFMWNDMSEPSIFGGPEVTSPKDLLHYPGWENRAIHNINGLIMHNLTSIGLTRRELGTTDKQGIRGVERRPFVLSRAWWLGTQRFGAVWTGDNMGTWEHFAGSVPMILANGIGGMSFCGADIGGFFGNPDTELLLRWYQAGIFAPFFRAHAHIDTKRREPYLYDGEMGDALRQLLQLRYQLLPVWYTAFWQSSVNGQPVIKPQGLVFPDDEQAFAVDDQFFVGDSGLLVKPPVHQGANTVDMYLSDDEVYYHFFSHQAYYGPQRRVTIPAPLDHQVPLLLRGGSILPLRLRYRRAAELQRRDPFTLYIAMSQAETAEGQLYLDDGQTFAYRDASAFLARRFSLAREEGVLRLRASALKERDVLVSSSSDAVFQQPGNPFEQEMAKVRVERLILMGWPAPPARVVATNAQGHTTELEWTHDVAAATLEVRDPRLLVAQDWQVVFEGV
ncbi:glucan 1,3-alpha-glucosidase [Malassezia nana]|uniref:Glucosidase II subunit alpha n=1 Tax=Malassezia nana TaxID=180528 RepID=A0AAF0J423_9BASI|nr:glucan 1,3-alpha-glucosidase [Malassezia nana]